MVVATLLLTEHAFRSYGDRVRAADPSVRFVRLQPGGGLLVDDRDVASRQVDPDVAWLTVEAFYDGAVAPFFELVHAKPSIRWLHSPAAGTDLELYRGLGARGVRVTTSHVNAIPIAEYVVGAVLAHYQQTHQWRAAQVAHEWEHHEFREIHGTTWLVVGLGAIGGAVATRATAFGARVIGVRRHPTGAEAVAELLTPDRLMEAVPHADVVVLAAPGTASTRHLANADFLAAMRPGSVLVNVGRGSLVDEDALLRALENGIPEVAILDVFAAEPLPEDHPFWDHPRVVVTPHSSAGGLGRHRRAVELFADNLTRYLRGEPLLHEADPAELP
jgi:phosphoglycerate dehydrogenase-like enzyme